MKSFTLTKVANQRIAVTVDGNTYGFRFRTFNEMLFADVEINGAAVAYGVRCCPYSFIIPYRHMEQRGNFFFTADDGKYPTYRDFGGGVVLAYIPYEQLDDMRKRWERLHR